ncbi:hypothetical protein AB4Y30_10860 [Ornithinibacillus sp. 4-3]|uniref:Uncharacterized protein n=1 Tax=Ornithinibacillus sp. 4-3 TaxID=3231488 RepID=A0AB39HMQ0_9BACI
MDRILDNIDKNIAIEDVSEDDYKLFERYTNKYITQTDVIPVVIGGVNKSINTAVSGSLARFAKGASLESDKERLKEYYEYMIEVIEKGESAAN